MVDEPSLVRTDRLVRSRWRFSISSNVIPGLVMASDSLAILSTGAITFFAIVGSHVEDPSNYAAAIAFVWLVAVALMNFGGAYQLEPILHPLSYADRILLAFITTFLFLLAAAFALKTSAEFSRLWLGAFAIGSCTSALLVRVIASYIVGHLVKRRILSRNMVVAGSGEQLQMFLGSLERSNPRFISVLGVFSDDTQNAQDLHYPMLGRVDDLPSYIRTNEVDDVVISLPWSADEKITSFANKLRELPVNTYLAADLVGFRLQFRPPPDHFGAIPLVEVTGRPLAGWGAFQKALLDYSLGLVLTVLFLPVMILVGIAIKIESTGPVMFRQLRYGFANRPFYIFKFRTMMDGPVSEPKTIQATQNDPRVTRIGRVLRRFSLDELPQLFNVLGGSMSLVGPRPHAVDHNEAYSQVIRGYFARHRVKPGLTGWAQVNGFRGETKTVEQMEARVKYDTYYVENWSLFFDLQILARTGVVCLTGRNAY